MYFTIPQVQSLAPKPTAYKAGEKLSLIDKWETRGCSNRVLWGSIFGSGSKPYYTQVDVQDLAYKCSCPSRQFPCKHAIGLMLSYAKSDNEKQEEEPEEIATWVNKRRKKAEPKEEKELTEEEITKREKAKGKRSEDREKLVNAGVEELELWLKDLIRTGFLELPNKPSSYFTKMSARLVDAKSSGLAGWIKSLGKLDYSSQEIWFPAACSIIARVYLILKSWKNKEQLTPEWQQSIKNLIGWSQSPKELMTDVKALAVKDNWLVLGQQRESIDEIVVQRTWLYGLKTEQSMLDLSFGSVFSPLENKFVAGMVLKAEVAFFSGQFPQRGIVRMTADTLNHLPEQTTFFKDISSVYKKINSLKVQYPWLNDQSILVQNVRLIAKGETFWISDEKGEGMKLESSFDKQSFMKWIMLTGNARVSMSIVLKQNRILPLGVFIDNKYFAL